MAAGAPASAAGGLAKAVWVGAVAGEEQAGTALAEALLLRAGETIVRRNVAASKSSDPRRAGVRRRRRARRGAWGRAGQRADDRIPAIAPAHVQSVVRKPQ